ncbi:GntR family transcriptional regulator [Bosea sp. Root381]|uniref:GntR family transcriptional regulator n=1 Tax=Bosea sp. Root381 TaxID=1736524 RepID=UPI000A5F07F9|nr:GntR family transcriptional regulator [Bosea sp. Root381]
MSLIEAEDLGARPTASDVIARHLREAIMSGKIKEGLPIRQDEIAGLFNVSKIPVREALKRLEAEGLVIFQRNRGAVVTEMSQFEIVQIFEVRALLEANAIKLSVPQMTAATFAAAQDYSDQFAAETDVAKWAELNWKFHSCLYEDANRPFMVGLIRSVNDRIERFLRIQLSLSAGQAVADQEHREILAACRAGDAQSASQLIHSHVMDACSSLLNSLGKSG